MGASPPRRCSRAAIALLAALVLATAASPADARTVYRCVRDGTVSLSTAPEPGSKCEAKELDDNAVQTPNLWGSMGVFSGTLYEREQDGTLVYGTRNLPGSRPYLRFTATTPPGEPAHEGLGQVGAPRLEPFAGEFRAAAKATGVEDAWLRAIAHAESAFDADALSPKGAQGVMQLMPDVVSDYGVDDPFDAQQSIRAGARHLRALLRRYDDDRTLALAAYNAGIGTVQRYGGVPPYAETQAYIAKVQALHARYREAMGFRVERPAQ
ncbi:lytic transglycosylase domain-containing protein [Luteimonas viscosa]|uniref:Lytic transglycosylase domain-containing protein n=1 Tax=Luteimonas viscosa TaxID=1132694 RepID=A0A5D4XW09_9GAMM|nr:lytic transglycosylase domain-containing protein [Luteimonas viscosa]TYT27050.1 lytic transglycosylase domain-containing protein [Luteimonas viscosa]